jgi:hypothetical protein
MPYILGCFFGICISILIFTILAFFRAGIEKRVRIIETVLGNAGPKVKGAIFLPEEEAEIARKEIIAKNAELGRDTPFDELM